jgi:hypothetical protein
MSAFAEQKILQMVRAAAQNRLYGEIVFRFRDGHLTFVTETRTVPAETLEDETRGYKSSR